MHTRHFTLGLLSLLGIAGAFAAEPPQMIFHNAKVVTVDSAFSIHSALAVRDGRIVAVGSDRDVRALAQPGVTEVIDLGGKFVMPGMIDSHVHAANASMTEFDHPIPNMETVQDVLDYIAARAKIVPEGEWISVSQVFITRLREARFPTRAELDAVAPKHPVSFSTGPDMMLNSLGLKLNGIDRNFEVKDGGPGYMDKDANGEPTGLLRGLGRYVKRSGAPGRRPTDADRLRRLKELFRDYNKIGLTAVCDRGAGEQQMALYQKLYDSGEQTVRVALSHTFGPLGASGLVFKAIDGVAEHPLRKDNGWLHLIGTKVWLDGGMLTGSAYMKKPWGRSEIYGISDPEYRGVLNIPEDRLYEIVERVASHGMQFTAHVQGDAAVTALVDAYERLNRKIPVKPLRMCLSHSSFMTKDTVERAARLGIVIDLQPPWLYMDARILVKQFGYDRLEYFQPLRSLFEAGAIAGGGSDHMQKIGDMRSINQYNPFFGMWITITRRARWHDDPVRPEQALSREQAIRFYTVNNAYVIFWDQEIGSLERGKRADFVVVDRDLLTCPVDAIKDARVLETWVEGRKVYSAGSE